MLEDKTEIEKEMAKLKAWVVKNPLNGILDLSFKIEVDAEHKCHTIHVYTTRYGNKAESIIGYDTAQSSEWNELSTYWKQFVNLSPLPFDVTIDKEDVNFTNYVDFYTHIMESGKKGNYIQRYKGLGEMNPEQLWETTLNPENRMLLQVNIEDAIAADETFSVLMGEQVEPRRKFINDNALLVRELDV